MKNMANCHIVCHVDNCRFHCTGDNYCTLDCISIGTHEKNPKEPQCTDCQSFQMK